MRKDLISLIVVLVIGVVIFSNFFGVVLFGPQPGESYAEKVEYGEFIEYVKDDKIEKVTLVGNKIIGLLLRDRDDSGEISKDKRIVAIDPETDNSAFIGLLLSKNIGIEKIEDEKPSVLMEIFISWFPMILLIAVWIFFMHQMQSPGGRGAMSFGKSKARLMCKEDVKTVFADVAGCDEAKEEVQELVEFLKDPGKFRELGGKIPTGVLMVGDPGTGKTLIARAVAGEAKVPFFSISGSDFVEMFVGVGASRVRDMFEQAKKQAPCIVFIDEIDAVGRHRGAGLGGGHDEREQTLNQLLVEMDGFEQNSGVIIIAATNRPDVLDPALLRPGRFDRHVQVPMPDIKGREQILNIHMKNLPSVHANVQSKIIARGTPGFSGADLANLVNEAALFAARQGKKIVSMKEFEQAKDKIMMGPERKSMVIDESDKRTTAYHEAGHCIVGRTMPDTDPAYKVTIIPRGRALGVTMFLPERDRLGRSKQHFESMLATAYGGRVAEEILLGPEKVTTGASNDILKATETARRMVTEWGLSDKIGPIAYSGNEKEVFVGRSITETNNISTDKANLIDSEIKYFLDEAFKVAKKILVKKINILHNMAEALLEYETIETEQIDDLMLGNKAMPIEKYRNTNNLDEGEIKNEDTISNLGRGFVFGRNKPGTASAQS